MKKKIFIAAATLFSFALKAQDSTKALDEIIVTANKFPNKVSLTGKVVTVISKEQIERSGSKDLAQLLSEQGGVFINGSNSNAGKDKSIYIRGAKIDHTLITIDGIPVYDASGIGSNFDIRLFSLDNVEQIEILKGSQSTLYGSDAIAGVINIITKKSSAKKINGFGGISYGTFNSIRANAGLTGTSNELNYNINYSYFKTKGINEVTDTLLKNPNKTDKDGYNQQNIYASLGWNPNKNVSIQPYLRYANIKGDIDQEAFIDELDYTFGLKNIQVGIKNRFNIGKNILNIVYNNNSINRFFLDDSTKSVNGWVRYSAAKYTSNEHYAEAYLLIPFNNVFKLTLGSDYRNSTTFQSFENVGLFDNNLNYTSLEYPKQHQLSLYTALNINTKKGFNIEAGSRLNQHSTYGNNLSFNINPSYLVMQQLKIFANLSSGYKTPSLYQLYSEYGNNLLKPESSINTEAGMQYQTLNGKINGRFTFFKRDIKDVIVFFYNPISEKSSYINQDKQFSNGVEIETSIAFSKSNSIKLFYAYNNGKVTTIENGKDTTYFNLIRQPKSFFTLTLNNKLTKNLFCNISVSHTGVRKDYSFDPITYEKISIDLKSYTLFNLYAEYSFAKNKIKVFTDLQNLFDTKFSEVYGYNTMGLNASVGIKFNTL